MAGIIPAAVIAALAAAGIYGGALALIAPRPERGLLLALLLLELPMSAATFFLVRRPLDAALHGALGDSGLYRALTTLYAPLTEEPAKLWPLLLPPLARRVTREGAMRAGAALGLGFGLGEIGLLARLILVEPRYAGIPWYQFTGFINERWMVCLIHAAFTAVAVCAWRRWRGGLALGLPLAMALHFLLNIAIVVVRLSPLGRYPVVASTLLSLWVAGFWCGAIVLLVVLNRATTSVPATTPGLFGEAICPECGRVYARSALALNLGARRLERCPHCGRWHLVPQFTPKY